MLHTKFRGNRHAGSGADFGRVFTIYGRGRHLGHVTSIILINFQFLVGLIFCTYRTLGQGQETTLTFNTHILS